MPSATKDAVVKGKGEKAMATTAISPGDDEPREQRTKGPAPEPAKVDGGGFFHIYKKGQGKWTRLGTAGGAGVIGLLCADFLYKELKTYSWFQDKLTGRPKLGLVIGIVGALLAGFALLVFWLMNKASNADFLIATDSEMKKVNWTSRKELIGSTKVVIAFMFLIAFLLFFFDVIFGYFFYLTGVLKSKPF